MRQTAHLLNRYMQLTQTSPVVLQLVLILLAYYCYTATAGFEREPSLNTLAILVISTTVTLWFKRTDQ